MIVYRLSKTKWAGDLTGEGAKLNGGRWNFEGVPCIYTSSNRALSVLEFSCHTSLENIPRALSFTLYKIPEDKIVDIKLSDFPGDWNRFEYSDRCRFLIYRKFEREKCLIIKVPSVVLNYEYNYLFNPKHHEFGLIKVSAQEDYSYDIRIKRQ